MRLKLLTNLNTLLLVAVCVALGVTLVPEMTLPVDRQGLRVIALQPPVERVFSLVLPAGQTASAAVQALLDLVAETSLASVR